MNLSKLWGIVKDREAWDDTVHGTEKSQTWFSDHTTNNSRNSLCAPGLRVQIHCSLLLKLLGSCCLARLILLQSLVIILP